MTVLMTKNTLAERLKERHRNDATFREMVENITVFYGRKVMRFAKEPADKEYVEEKMLEVISAQFLQGYFIMENLLSDPDFSLNDSVWGLSKGSLRNAVYPLLEEVMQDSGVQWQQSDVERAFTKRVIDNFYDAYEVMQQLRIDVLTLGAYNSLIEQEQYQEPQAIEHTLKLGNPFDLNFLNPQVYMQSDYTTETSEKWVLFQAEQVKGSQWVGDIQLSNRSMIPGTVQNYLQLSLSVLMDPNDQTDIINKMASQIPDAEKGNTILEVHYVTHREQLEIH